MPYVSIKHVAETAANLTAEHPHYALLAGRIEMSRLYKKTPKRFSTAMEGLYFPGRTLSLRASFLKYVRMHADELDSAIVQSRDFDLDYFAVKTLSNSYLASDINRVPMERPQHLFMRVAVAIHNEDLEHIIETYDLMSRRYFIHASPTLYNAGFRNGQLASCFLLPLPCNSRDDMYACLRKCATISEETGGIGISVHDVPASGSVDPDTGITAAGLVPLLKLFNESVNLVDQGVNKRPGAMAVYLEPWHMEIFEFLDLRRNHGKEEMRARNLFYALWIPDLFMKRVESDALWTLFCPRSAPLLSSSYGEEFEDLYASYERADVRKKSFPARELWQKIIQVQVETGMPFMLYKDATNVKSNHNHLGTITCSNLCTEIIQFSSDEETAVCNLASVALPSFVLADQTFDFQDLHRVTKIVTVNLNRVIDAGIYPTPDARRSSVRHRAIGVGVQGLVETFYRLRLPVESSAALELNARIFETIYHATLDASCELAVGDGAYDSWTDSNAWHGSLQFDLWGVAPSDMWDWTSLRARIAKYGLRNSLLVALMPTASTSQILGFSEGIEVPMSNLFNRRVLSGEFQVVSSTLVHELSGLGLWTPNVRRQLFEGRGSIQHIEHIPAHLKDLFKTAWEISQQAIIDLAVGRAPFICQSQSLTIYVAAPTTQSLTSMHFYGWKRGLKTGMYYLRTQPAAFPLAFTVEGHEGAAVKTMNNDPEENRKLCLRAWSTRT
ncbi:ribonucleoside-diphosphate reductase large subunit [Leucogyrophana mollusca]|uniref:Ribonucleoside-diphosphate reductase large subunit n=1 Tax=Leucogyrophana mollusca TaxID=85980 RepID=A0ACB8BN02_9AGAM|nr:ribonucleoside-diphosphate reductase large subunit [Leucogyrophana mollusca]